MGLTFDCVLEMDSINDMLAARGLQDSGPVQRFVDSEVIRYCDPKVPYRSGMLKDSVLTASVIGSGLIVYAAPYARPMYYNPQYNFNGAPERGAYWAERMFAEHAEDIVRGAAAIVGGAAE